MSKFLTIIKSLARKLCEGRPPARLFRGAYGRARLSCRPRPYPLRCSSRPCYPLTCWPRPCSIFCWPLLLLALCLFLTQHPAPLQAAALSERELVQALKKEEGNAKERRAGLSRLTQEERRLNADLAAAEDRIMQLESGLEKQQTKLTSLASSGENLQNQYEALAAERQKTEDAMNETLRTLWELHSRRLGVGGRDLPDWHVTDREYIWSNELLASLEVYRIKIQDQEVELGKVRHSRQIVGEDINAQINLITREKEKLLTERVRYAERLAILRNQKQDAEAELSATLQLISNLNFSIKTARERESQAQAKPAKPQNTGQVELPGTVGITGGNIEQAKGSLVRPVNGKVGQSFRPDASPPVRGLVFETPQGSEVRAAHGGRVMYNDTMRGRGRVVVLQHGDAYFTVYAFLAESLVRSGQEVKRGQAIGRSGMYADVNGENQAPGLYFELRFHQKAVNPDPWLAK